METAEETVETKPTAKAGLSIVWTLRLILIVLIGMSAIAVAIHNSPMPKRWEYQIVFINDSIATNQLNILGDSGWEIVGSRRASDNSNKFGYEVIVMKEK